VRDSLERLPPRVAIEISISNHDVVILKGSDREHVETTPRAKLALPAQGARRLACAAKWQNQLAHQLRRAIVENRKLRLVVEAYFSIRGAR
jgi:hypothetical protein